MQDFLQFRKIKSRASLHFFRRRHSRMKCSKNEHFPCVIHAPGEGAAIEELARMLSKPIAAAEKRLNAARHKDYLERDRERCLSTAVRAIADKEEAERSRDRAKLDLRSMTRRV